MFDLRPFVAKGLALASALALAAPLAGCGDGGEGDQAVQTEEMDQHLDQVTQNYAEQYSKQYRGGQ
ncbi:hypothetical protein [Tautonia plasticadhaerens]|uniref:Secreted protein n=1 Tax=Tautonia plasticadhaerens TaxID=2527974 RepID=A0A518H086_9BACT|nr:hypothetical protein [Tautonia plasticadhaerens]QDV34257.1 hypothetical protein ElP_21420 [Tautonia plasticadhaerens]